MSGPSDTHFATVSSEIVKGRVIPFFGGGPRSAAVTSTPSNVHQRRSMTASAFVDGQTFSGPTHRKALCPLEWGRG